MPRKVDLCLIPVVLPVRKTGGWLAVILSGQIGSLELLFEGSGSGVHGSRRGCPPLLPFPPCPLPPGWPAPPAEYAIVYSLGVGGWLGFLLDAPASGADWSVLLPTFRLAGVRCGLRLGPGLQ